MKKEKRSPVRGHELEKPSSPPLEKEDKGIIFSPGTKSNPGLGHDDLVK